MREREKYIKREYLKRERRLEINDEKLINDQDHDDDKSVYYDNNDVFVWSH